MIKPVSERVMSLMLFFTLALSAGAQLVDGKVYLFKNKVHNQQAMTADGTHSVRVATPVANDYKQLWIAEAGKDGNAGQFALRNLNSGLYLRNPEVTSRDWTLVDAGQLDKNCYNYCVKRGQENYYTMVPNAQGNSHNCMHANGSGTIVCWEFAADASQWTIEEETSITADIIEAQKKVWNAHTTELGSLTIYETALAKIFTDKACTQLNSTYAGKSVDQIKADAEYQKLSPTLQRMVIKVKTGDWSEDNGDANKQARHLGWNSDYAKKFRVQLIEPYSDPWEAGQAIHIARHSNLNNPTGIYAQNNQLLYVMVEGAIAQGSELYLSYFTGHGKPDINARSGVKLREGLNIVPFYNNETATLLNYVVETFKNGQKTNYRLSQFKDLKVHIEGGHINGYFNAVGDDLYKPDNDEDWKYYEQRANLKDFTILGKYQTIHFFLHNVTAEDGKTYNGLATYLPEQASVQDVIATWDRVMMSERLTLGLLSKKEIEEANRLYPTLDDRNRGIYTYMGDDEELPIDYSDHYRLHGLAYSTLSGYMYGGDDHSGYNVSTMQDIIANLGSRRTDLSGSVWGPGHEIGHQHQAVFNMRGLTEVTNNLFANVAVWYDGRATSRINGSDGALQTVQNVYNQPGTDFFHNNIWAQTHLYYKLWLYYHLTGHNNKFYPRLFEMLRRDPMIIEYDQRGTTSLLHFYKMCCKAAKEDLTEFFRAYGFFTPMDKRHVGDYSNADYTQTQEEIDAAIAEIKKLGYPENHNVLFINDCTGQPSYGHDGKTERVVFDYSQGAPIKNADLGMYTGFYLSNTTTSGKNKCTVSNNKLTVSGDLNGVGILLYDKQGNLLGFSDRTAFPLNAQQTAAYLEGNLKIEMVDGKGNLTPIEMESPETSYLEILKAEIKRAEVIESLKDETETIVTYYRAPALAAMEQALSEARAATQGSDTNAMAAAYHKLHEEIEKLEADPDAKVQFVPGSTYRIKLKGNDDDRSETKYLKSNGQSASAAIGLAVKAEADEWLFEATGVKGAYYLKNERTGDYMQSARNNTPVELTADKEKAAKYLLKANETNFFVLTCHEGENNISLNYNKSSNKLIGWSGVDNYSRWQLEQVKLNTALVNRATLTKLVREADRLTAQMKKSQPITLQTTNEQEANFLYCNAPSLERNGDYSPADKGYNLLDKNLNTYLHTDYSGKNSADGLDHYLRVDFGAAYEPCPILMKYVTRHNGQGEAPKTIFVQTSTDNKTYITVDTLTQLPTTNGAVYTSPDYVPAGRYVRFMVTENQFNQQKGGHAFFSMASFDIETVGAADSYSSVKKEVEAVLLQKGKAANVLANLAATEEELSEALKALQTACEALNNALASKGQDYDLEVSAYGYASFYLDRNLQMPAGVTAYTASAVESDRVKLTPVANGLVPACTPVIVKADPGVYRLTYVADSQLSPVTPNLLKGTLTEAFIKGEPGKGYYLFGARQGEVGLYKAWLEYREDGTQTEEIDDTDLGGYFHVAAHKVWLPVDDVASYAPLLVFDLDDVQTSITAPVTGQPQTKRIYDLQGRQLRHISQPGIYLINGKKVWVNPRKQ